MDAHERMRDQADLQQRFSAGLMKLPEELRRGVVALRLELPDVVWKDFTQRLLDAWPSVDEMEAWSKVAADANKELDRYLREVMPGLPEHYGMPVDGVRQVVAFLTKTDWPRLVKKLQDEVADKTGGRLVVGLLNGALVVGERELAPPLQGGPLKVRTNGSINLTELIAVWDLIHERDLGDLSYSDLETAMQMAGVELVDDTARPELGSEEDDG